MKKDKNFFQGHTRLAEERERLFSTQQEAADFFGVSRVTWGQCERGNAVPSGDVLAGLAQNGADVLYILTGVKTPAVTMSPDQHVLLNNYERCTHDGKQHLIQTSVLLSQKQPAPANRVEQNATFHNSGNDVVQVNHAHAPITVGATIPQTRTKRAAK